MASIAGHEQEQQGRGQMKRKQVTAIITAAILAVSACMPVSSIGAIAAEAGAEAEAAVEEDEAGEAKAAVVSMMQDKQFGKSGERIVIEEFLEGPEVSVKKHPTWRQQKHLPTK